MKPVPGSPMVGDHFRIESGDGDQGYFSQPINLKLVEANWFPGYVPPFGEALLFEIENGRHAGEYLALTARGGGFRERLEAFGYCGVMVHRITSPGAGYDRNGDKDLEGVGRTYVERLGPGGYREE